MKLGGGLLMFGAVMAAKWSFVRADICLMIFYMADNNLEYFLRGDLLELTKSSAVKDRSVTTWAYFDHRNYGTSEDIYTPLENVYDSNGNRLSGQKPTTSQILRWDHSLGKMVVVETGTSEADSDNPNTLYWFLRDALPNCIARGSDEFIVMMSSHGAGAFGFGGDDNTRKRRYLEEQAAAAAAAGKAVSAPRRLVQPNTQIVAAIRTALMDTSGAPSEIDVLGFDACLMQALGAMDEFRSITKYYLASEAVVPGLGYAYDELSDVSSSVNFAKQIQRNFLSSKQGYSTHLTPKTLALVDSDKFNTFLSRWETLSGVMEGLLYNEDPDFHVQVNRVRNKVIAFEASIDDAGTLEPSAVDMGDFLSLLKERCVPQYNSALDQTLDAAIDAYDDMFVIRGVGEGTKAATGMHVLWPVKREYYSSQSYYNGILFDSNRLSATTAAPNWLDFMQRFYYTSETPPAGSPSVCTLGLSTPVASTEVETELGELLIDPVVSSKRNGGHVVQSGVAREVDSMSIEYGVDFTPFLDDRRLEELRRRTSESDEGSTKASNMKKSQRPMFEAMGELRASASADGTSSGRRNPQRAARNKASPRRQGYYQQQELQQQQQQGQDDEEGNQRQLSSNDYFIMYGGDVYGEFGVANYTAYWNRRFYLVEDDEGYTNEVYAFDRGHGERLIPVMYIPDDVPISSSDMSLRYTEDDYVDLFEAEYGFLSFSADGSAGQVISDGITLYTHDGTTYSETPRTAGGKVVPVLYVDGVLGGTQFDVLVGGFFNTILDWSETAVTRLYAARAEDYVSFSSIDYLVVDIVAYDDDALLDPSTEDYSSDFTFFVIDANGQSYDSQGKKVDDTSTPIFFSSAPYAGVYNSYTIMFVVSFVSMMFLS